MCFPVRLLEEQQERQVLDLQTLDHESDIANHRMNVELLKERLNDLDKNAGAETQVRLYTR